jgi:hypothetical protein
MDKKTLRFLSVGLYRDENGVLYIYMREFLKQHKLPDTPEVRQAVMEQIKTDDDRASIIVIEE